MSTKEHQTSITQINTALQCRDKLSYNDHGFNEQNYLTFLVPFGYLTTKAFSVRAILWQTNTDSPVKFVISEFDCM